MLFQGGEGAYRTHGRSSYEGFFSGSLRKVGRLEYVCVIDLKDNGSDRAEGSDFSGSVAGHVLASTINFHSE
jgi:hypothetical protein